MEPPEAAAAEAMPSVFAAATAAPEGAVAGSAGSAEDLEAAAEAMDADGASLEAQRSVAAEAMVLCLDAEQRLRLPK